MINNMLYQAIELVKLFIQYWRKLKEVPRHGNSNLICVTDKIFINNISDEPESYFVCETQGVIKIDSSNYYTV